MQEIRTYPTVNDRRERKIKALEDSLAHCKLELREIRAAVHAVLAEVSSSKATDSLVVINLRRMVTYYGGP